MKRVLLMLMLLLTITTVSSCAKKEESLVVGLEAAYAPFNWTTQKSTEYTHKLSGNPGYVDGYDVQMAKYIANKLGKKLIIKAIEWDGLIPALQSKQIDLIIAGMSPTETRKQTIGFTDYYFVSEQVIVILKDSKFKDATSINDFSGAKIVNQLGTLQDDLTPQIPNVIHLTPLESYGAITQAVRSKEADGFIAELPVAMSVASTNSDLTYILFQEGSGFDVSMDEISVSIGTRKNEPLLSELNEILKSISDEQRATWMREALARQNT